MSERSFELAKQSIIGTSKYDYFIVGIGAATFAFFAKDFEFLTFGLNEKTLVLIALLLLILSIVSGLKKIDVYNFFVEKNGKILDQKEKRAGYIKSCETQTVYINKETGEIVSPDNSEIKAIGMQVVIERWEKKLRFTETKLCIYYYVRDYSLVFAYLLLGFSKFVNVI